MLNIMLTTKTKDPDADFQTIEPSILYFGTPVALVSSVNEDGSPNLAPLSSSWALGWTMVLGLLPGTQTLENFRERPDCVINFPSPDMWRAVERLAPLTGRNPVPADKASKFRFEPDKFAVCGFTPLESACVLAPRVMECPVQLEARVSQLHMLQAEPRLETLGGGVAVEVRILKVHICKDFVLHGNYVDPNKWQPLIYNFRHYFGLGAELGKTFRAEI
jgi:flavin reductase (DIM6/NTAB) family NADH-FMN oxidoreductase RutF